MKTILRQIKKLGECVLVAILFCGGTYATIYLGAGLDQPENKTGELAAKKLCPSDAPITLDMCKGVATK